MGPGKDNSFRTIVLAFYNESDPAAAAWKQIRASSACCVCLTPDKKPEVTGKSCDRLLARYSSLRLPKESLLVVETNSSDVSAAVKLLRGEGEPAVFFSRSEGRQSAGLQKPAKGEKIHNWSEILDRVQLYERSLKATRTDLIEATRLDHAVTESGKWILDNTHLLRAAITDVRSSLPSSFRHTLSRFRTPRGDLPVVELASQAIAACDSAVHAENLVAAVSKYQKAHPLSIAELWVFPVVLRFVLLEVLARLAHQVSTEQQLREEAYLWANRLATAARSGAEDLGAMMAQLAKQPKAMEPYFYTCLAEQLQDEEAALVPFRQWVEGHRGVTLSELVPREHQREAAETLSIANAFNSLRVLSQIDFAEFFESLNVVEQELRRDPSGTYPHNDFKTRDRCRRALEKLSKQSGIPEPEVARKVIETASRSTDPEKREVCWYLLGEGLSGLEKELGARLPLRKRTVRFVKAHPTFFYLSGIAGITLAIAAVALSLAYDLGVRSPVILAILGTLSVFPLSELAIQIVNALIISSFAPEPLAKLDFKDGVPAEHATLVVVPMMLTSVEVVRQELEKLEVRFLANRDENICFSLFSDFTDADEQTKPEDARLYEALRSGMEGLNSRYHAKGTGTRFLLFHRERVWSETQEKWIGRERKRGKIEELNRFLLGKGDPGILRVGSLASQIRYVITLDSDTQLPPDCGSKLIATIAHPLNRPVLDAATKVRKRGFSIIQPRVSIGLPEATASRFTRIFADTSGTDPYCHAVSDAQQDLFGEAIFHGKAIYDLEAFHEAVGNRFPAETLLSHDLIEGSFAGVGLASDIELFENMPVNYAGFCKRAHRWIRGDWQIAAWMLRNTPTVEANKRVRNPLSAISRWRIFDNLRRSLVAPASILLLIFGWLISAAK